VLPKESFPRTQPLTDPIKKIKGGKAAEGLFLWLQKKREPSLSFALSLSINCPLNGVQVGGGHMEKLPSAII